MTKDQEMIKNFGILMLNFGTFLGQAIVLVLKSNGELFYLDPCGENVFSKSTLINSSDGTYLAWRLFDSFSIMESFIVETCVVGQPAVGSSALSEAEILSNGYVVS